MSGSLVRGDFLVLLTAGLSIPALAKTPDKTEALHRYLNDIVWHENRGRQISNGSRPKAADFLTSPFPGCWLRGSKQSPYMIWQSPSRYHRCKTLLGGYDPIKRRLLIVEQNYTWGQIVFTALYRPPYRLRRMDLSHFTTTRGFSIGSPERTVVQRLGEGDVFQNGTLRTRNYTLLCGNIEFRFQSGSVVEIRWGDC
jgi:hypothetical protein